MHATQTMDHNTISLYHIPTLLLATTILSTLPTTTKMMLSSATTRDREDESLPLPTGHHRGRNKKFFDFTSAGRPFTSLRSILTVGGLVLLLVLNLRNGESLYQSQSQGHSEGKFFFISCLLTTDTSCSKFP